MLKDGSSMNQLILRSEKKKNYLKIVFDSNNFKLINTKYYLTFVEIPGFMFVFLLDSKYDFNI